MAEKNSTDQKLETYAFRLFSDRSAVRRNASEALAVDCFRDAQMFLSIAARVSAGEIGTDKPTAPPLADACAPKLPRTHPINIVSQFFAPENGGEAKVLNRINAITKRLNDHPTLDSLPAIGEGNEAIELNWGPVEVKTARTILPAYATN